MKIVVLERNSVGLDVSVDIFKAFGEVTVYPNTTAVDVKEKVRDAEIIIANKAPLNSETLKDAHDVKLICEFATGYDNVDITYCKSRGIKVANIVGYSTDAVAQHTFALCLYVLEKLRHYDDYVKSGAYAAQDRFSNFDIPFTELAGKTWGIVGMGNIGRKVAGIAEAFGCKVIFYSASGNSTCTEYERVEFDKLLKESDFLSIHCPLSDKTRDLFDLEAFKKMKKSAILINVARGPVVNDAALYTALAENYIAGAGLDVTSTEPMKSSNPLSKIMDSNKLIITPHLAWASNEARNRCVSETCKNIEAFLKGENRNIVNL
ncbi:D-2-hydroxyacid dehydrogenase [Parablautia muri]|uniref:D-2-hydroxyacid dehydrogenase n=1 Tax=Parablautia muri TaxID=2320879 RepID=A0A9X5BCH3_9FIRM|nr:D-2-hydroxyacid dehydrogenase [Parablautia muri]NBJ91078.1 D-2-hydroxyacid dehydrogenase [Parablautia muri]